MTLEEVDARLEERKREMAETSARLQGYMKEIERLNQLGLTQQGAINELTSIRAKMTEDTKETF